MCMHVYVYVFVCICDCVYMDTCRCMHECMYVCICVCQCVYTHACVCLCSICSTLFSSSLKKISSVLLYANTGVNINEKVGKRMTGNIYISKLVSTEKNRTNRWKRQYVIRGSREIPLGIVVPEQRSGGSESNSSGYLEEHFREALGIQCVWGEAKRSLCLKESM